MDQWSSFGALNSFLETIWKSCWWRFQDKEHFCNSMFRIDKTLFFTSMRLLSCTFAVYFLGAVFWGYVDASVRQSCCLSGSKWTPKSTKYDPTWAPRHHFGRSKRLKRRPREIQGPSILVELTKRALKTSIVATKLYDIELNTVQIHQV